VATGGKGDCRAAGGVLRCVYAAEGGIELGGQCRYGKLLHFSSKKQIYSALWLKDLLM
jgi:hypothetical protein